MVVAGAELLSMFHRRFLFLEGIGKGLGARWKVYSEQKRRNGVLPVGWGVLVELAKLTIKGFIRCF